MGFGWPVLRGFQMATKKRKRQLVRGWCTLYGLTRGIYPVVVEIPPTKPKWGTPWLIVQTDHPGVLHPMLRENIDFFRTRKDALANVKERAEALVLDLKIRIAKVERAGNNPRVLDRDPNRRGRYPA